jgi:hypothetical protein
MRQLVFGTFLLCMLVVDPLRAQVPTTVSVIRAGSLDRRRQRLPSQKPTRLYSR